MKKLKSNILIILFFIILLILITTNTMIRTLTFSDELWNFQSIYKMYNGGTIYTDNNVLITPLFFLLGNFIFQILGANILIFRIYNVFIFLAKYVLSYIILRKLNINKVFSVAYTLIFFVLDFSAISSGANYNMLSLTFSLAGIILYLCRYSKKYYHLLQGIVIFLVFFTKQTVGVYYAFGIVLFEILDIGFNKEFFKNQFTKLATFLPCLGICLVFMLLKGNLFNFINLCFGGIFEFNSSHRKFATSALSKIAFMLITVVFAISIIRKNSPASENLKINIKFLLALSIGLTFNMFPLANKYHTNMALMLYVFLFIYMIDTILLRDLFTSKKHITAIALICIITLSVFSGKLAQNYSIEYSSLEALAPDHPFYNAKFTEYSREKIDQLTEYISKKKTIGTQVIVLSYEAAGYMVPLKINNNEFDLPFKGNWGYNGTQNIINKISNMKNTEFLILTYDDDVFYQESQEVREFIINNFEKTGEISDYSIYINK